MPAVSFDIVIECGATYTASFEWRSDDGSSPPSGPLIDTTNYDPFLQMRVKVGGELIAQFDSATGLTVTDGVIALRIGADITETITRPGIYALELHNRLDPSDVVRLVQGKVSTSPEVTTSPEVIG